MARASLVSGAASARRTSSALCGRSSTAGERSLEMSALKEGETEIAFEAHPAPDGEFRHGSP